MQYPMPIDGITIEARFRGPPDSGNGGYVAGAIASHFSPLEAADSDDAIEVTLRAPTPLDQPMAIQPSGANALLVTHGETLVAEAQRKPLTLNIPSPPDYASAAQARKRSPSFQAGINPLLPEGRGFHPICFCCGADVTEQEGLHVYAAPVAEFDGVAAAWRPHPGFANSDGYLPDPIIWAALDCPGQFAYFANGIRTGMLGRMTGKVVKPVVAQQNLVVAGWCIDVERSKHFAGTALFDESGDLCAYSKQVWIGRRD